MSKTSKFISLILRHSPEVAGIALGTGGWASIPELLKGMKAAGHPLTRADLMAIVAEDNKQRFTVSADGQSIRAAQGHTVPVDLGLQPTRPPEHLYHGTAAASMDGIFRDGAITPRARQKVHLSASIETALRVGQRHGRPIVLTIKTLEMSEAGHLFWQADNGVWLVNEVPVAFIEFGAQALQV